MVKFTILWLFGHKFWTSNTKKPIKGLKGLDFSLFCTRSLSKILPSYGWGPGPDNLSLKVWTYPTYDATPPGLRKKHVFSKRTKKNPPGFFGFISKSPFFCFFLKEQVFVLFLTKTQKPRFELFLYSISCNITIFRIIE